MHAIGEQVAFWASVFVIFIAGVCVAFGAGFVAHRTMAEHEEMRARRRLNEGR